MNCVIAPVDRISDQDASAATTGLAAQPTLPLGQAYGKAPRAQTRRSGPHWEVCVCAICSASAQVQRSGAENRSA
jgi:hypothetical protein